MHQRDTDNFEKMIMRTHLDHQSNVYTFCDGQCVQFAVSLVENACELVEIEGREREGFSRFF